MPYTEHEDKSGGVTVTSEDTGKSFHAPSEAAAKRDERLHEEFKHMKDGAGVRRYAADEEAVTERLKKIPQVEANYRSAFSAARCGDCAHFQTGSGTCELVEGKISADGVCDLYQPKREDATEAASRLYAEHQVERYSNADGQLPSETADVSPAKAKQILRDGTVNGQPLTESQRGMFGAIAGKDAE